MNHKSFPFAVKQVDMERGTFSGHAAIFHAPDDGIPPDIIVPGAFTKTIQEWGPAGANRIKVMAMHRPDWLPIGRPTELKEDERGLWFSAKISETSVGRDILTLLRDGVLTEMSIGFDVIKSQDDPARKIRVLQEIRLWEISPVTWAMQPLATIQDVKEALRARQPDQASTGDPPAAPQHLIDPDLIQSMKRLIEEWKSYHRGGSYV